MRIELRRVPVFCVREEYGEACNVGGLNASVDGVKAVGVFNPTALL